MTVSRLISTACEVAVDRFISNTFFQSVKSKNDV